MELEFCEREYSVLGPEYLACVGDRHAMFMQMDSMLCEVASLAAHADHLRESGMPLV